MAVVIDPKDVKQFLAYAAEENLEATEVAIVTESPRLVLEWRGKEIVNLSRAFLDTNGAHQETTVRVDVPEKEQNMFVKPEVKDVRDKWMTTLADLNQCSQKGLVERFDGSIGAWICIYAIRWKISADRSTDYGCKIASPERKM